MSPVGTPGTGWPDHEERPMPHGDTLAQDGAFTATAAGTVVDNAGDGWHVAAYRSFVVQVQNDDVVPVAVTPRWSFFAVSSSRYTESTQIVPAGTKKRLLFQNEGDWVERVLFQGIGANAAMRYYITGSNLDPLPVSAMPICHLVGVAAGVQVSASGVGFNVQFLQSPAFSFISDASVFSLNTVAPGVTDTVTLLSAGMFIATAAFSFAGAAVFPRQASIVMRNGGVPPRPNAPTLDGDAANENDFALADILPLSAVDASLGNGTVQVSGIQTSGGNIVIQAAMLRIVRLTPIDPFA